MITNCGQTIDLLGLSTDSKPEDALPNTLYLELDTGDFYYFDAESEKWAKVGEAPSDAKSAPALSDNLKKGDREPLPFEDDEEEIEEESDGEEVEDEPEEEMKKDGKSK